MSVGSSMPRGSAMSMKGSAMMKSKKKSAVGGGIMSSLSGLFSRKAAAPTGAPQAPPKVSK